MPSTKSATKKRPAKKAPAKKAAPKRPDPAIALVAEILEGYANRAVFRGFSRGPQTAGKATFKVLWHRDRFFDIVFDRKARTITMPLVLPEVDPAMFKDFQKWILTRHSKELVEHRRIDTRLATLTTARKSGNVSLTITGKASKDLEYATRRLIHTVHEVFLSFLTDGPYFEYMVEKFDLDPDKP